MASFHDQGEVEDPACFRLGGVSSVGEVHDLRDTMGPARFILVGIVYIYIYRYIDR